MNTKRFTLFAYLFTVTVLMLGLSACDRVSKIVQPTPPQMTETSQEIVIGIVLPLTGRFSYAAGSPLLQSFELACSEINAASPHRAKLRFIIEDDQSTIEGAVAAFNKLIHQDGVSVLLGPATSSQTAETFPIAQENQVLAISPTSSARGLSALGDYVFRIALTTDILIPNGIAVTHKTRLSTRRYDV